MDTVATDVLPDGYRRVVLEFRILGPLEVVGRHGPVGLGGPKQRATLAILVLNANRVVSIHRLADELYAGHAPVSVVTQVHRQISELRKALGEEPTIETRAPGYVIRIAAEQLDLKRFERLTEEAGRALARGDAETAFELQRDALALVRGPVLEDLAHEPFAQVAIGRLDEMLLAALEQRLDAELALGRHRKLVGELGDLAARHPLHEPFAARLMLALYRSGRQTDALDVYRRTRERLVGDFGIEPGQTLHELERAILGQEASLDVEAGAAKPRPVGAPDQIVLVLPSVDERLDVLLEVAQPLARLRGRALLIARLLPDETLLASTAATLGARRASLGPETRTAAFTTVDPVGDAVRLATAYDVRLVLLDVWTSMRTPCPTVSQRSSKESPADVGLLTGSEVDWATGDGVCVPFAGGEHDWAALELGAWLASSRGSALRLVGSRADARRGRRDASRLLADASLSVQRAVGVDASPQLVDADPAALVEAVESAAIVVTGLSAKWRGEGLGDARAPWSAAAGRHCSCTGVPGQADLLLRQAAPALRGRSRA